MATERTELLAPAGDWEALRAAVANGADAVYFGLPLFNARHRAANFTLEELPDTIAYLHARDARGYVALNTLIFANELETVLTYTNAIVAAGVDAVIVQDLGLALLLQRHFPNLVVHASTQTTQTEARGINLLKELGIRRVILARELNLTEIATLREQTDVPLEVFVHGALCVAYSGQCLTSEALGGRSANRGQCAQACRQPYQLFVDGQRHELGDRAYLLSPQDLAAYDLVDRLVQLGVCSLKIEGRMKGGPYVAAATHTYRQALDAALAHRPFTLANRDHLDLEQTFSRGLFHGFLDGVDHQLTTPARFPKHRGVYVGIVVGLTRQGALIELTQRDMPWSEFVKPGDGLVFDQGRPEDNEVGGRVTAVNLRSQPQARPMHVEVRFLKNQVAFERVLVGALVWKTDDPVVRRRLQQTYSSDKPIQRTPITFTLDGNVGGPLALRGQTASRSASAIWQGPLERAVKHAATPETVRDQLSRLHDTPFALAKVTLACPDPVLVPKSVLNELRRQVVTQLVHQAGTPAAEPVSATALALLRQELVESRPKAAVPEQSRLYVLVRTMEQLRTIAEWPFSEGTRPSRVYCDFEDVRRYREAVTIARTQSLSIGLATLRIVKPGEDKWLQLLAETRPNTVLIRNLASLAYFRERCPELELIGDFSLNIVNDLAADWCRRKGLTRVTPGFDLNWEQFVALIEHSEPGWYEPVIHYRMPMFHMEHCVFAAFLSQGKDWRDCGRPCDQHRLDVQDPSGARFPVIPDAGCRNTVYNQLAQSAAEYLPRMTSLGIRHFRIELLREEGREVGRLVNLYQRALAGESPGEATWRAVRALNQIGVTRGTLQLL